MCVHVCMGGACDQLCTLVSCHYSRRVVSIGCNMSTEWRLQQEGWCTEWRLQTARGLVPGDLPALSRCWTCSVAARQGRSKREWRTW